MTLEDKTRRIFLRRLLIEVPFGIAAIATTHVEGLPSFRDPVEVMQSVKLSDTPLAQYTGLILLTAERLMHQSHSPINALPDSVLTVMFMGNALGTELTIRYDAQLPEREVPKRISLMERFNNFFGDIILPRERENHRRLFFSSLALCVLGRVLDSYSTIRCARLMQDPRFREYGFHKYIFELNPLIKPHPSPYYLFNPLLLAQEAVVILLSYLSPLFGFGFIADSLHAYLNNTHVADMTKIGYKVGDAVKAQLNEGRTRQQIVQYLKNLQLKDLVHQIP